MAGGLENLCAKNTRRGVACVGRALGRAVTHENEEENDVLNELR